MTDLATKNSSGDPFGTSGDASATPEVQWAPTEPAPKKRRLWLWIGVPAGLVIAGAAAASALLIAPGTTVAGVPVGFMTEGAANDAVRAHLAETQITVGDGGPTVTAAELGATTDSESLASAAFAERPMWNVSQWFGEPVAAEISLDGGAATEQLRAAVPDAFIDPVAARVAFDGTGAYVVTPAADGTGIDLGALSTELQTAFDSGTTAITVDAVPVAVPSTLTTEAAQATADSLNNTLATAGFYVNDERTVPIDAATAASWITVTADESTGEFQIDADTAAIQSVVDGLAEQVNQDPVDGTVVVNDGGTVINTVVEGQQGRVLGDTSSVASDYAAQLAAGEGAYRLPVEVTENATSEIVRLLEVDISEQRLYLKENGAVVDSWLISSGRYGADTQLGRYTIGWKTPIQDMRGTAADSGVTYLQPDVRWAMYFNGDQAFHGVYWHDAWGTRKSAGCVGMPDWRAEQIYGWAAAGTDVWIHA